MMLARTRELDQGTNWKLQLQVNNNISHYGVETQSTFGLGGKANQQRSSLSSCSTMEINRGRPNPQYEVCGTTA